jgi:hypothetical protein
MPRSSAPSFFASSGSKTRSLAVMTGRQCRRKRRRGVQGKSVSCPAIYANETRGSPVGNCPLGGCCAPGRRPLISIFVLAVCRGSRAAAREVSSPKVRPVQRPVLHRLGHVRAGGMMPLRLQRQPGDLCSSSSRDDRAFPGVQFVDECPCGERRKPSNLFASFLSKVAAESQRSVVRVRSRRSEDQRGRRPERPVGARQPP